MPSSTILATYLYWLLETPCAGYLGYPFQNQEVNSHAGNLNTTYLMRRLPRKRNGRAITSALFRTDMLSSQHTGVKGHEPQVHDLSD